MPKFLCVKGILFFTFWQGFAVSILVALGIVKSGEYLFCTRRHSIFTSITTTDRFPTEMLSLAIQDTAISLEMPLFAFLHMFVHLPTPLVCRG